MRIRFGLRSLILLIVGAALSSGYVGSYYWFSRRGMSEAGAETDIFFYVPGEELAVRRGRSRHDLFVLLYGPLNWADRRIFGANAAAANVLWTIGGQPDDP